MAWSKESRHARGYGWHWVKLRNRIMRRDLYLCQTCKATGRATPATEVHHIRAKADGGTDDPANLTAICRECHEAATREQTGRKAAVLFGQDGRVLW